MKFLNNQSMRILTAVLVLQAVIFYGLSRKEYEPNTLPLSSVPMTFGGWTLAQEGVVDKETQDVLKADDLLSRSYINLSAREQAHLFVAFFRSQRTGKTPHSPKNCLPGNGWVQSIADQIAIEVPGVSRPLVVNHYIVAKGDAKSVVLYWYQSRDRVVASEYRAKFYVMADAIRYNRTDTSLIRVVVPVTESNDVAATKSAVDFVKAFYVPLRQYLPS